MKSPEDLLNTLNLYEDTQSAIAVYKEAASYIKAYRAVQQTALECAQAEMITDGVKHHKDNVGSAGWTKPKTARLDKERWTQVIRHDPGLRQLQAEADAVQARLEAAQREAGCFVLAEPRFFIR